MNQVGELHHEELVQRCRIFLDPLETVQAQPEEPLDRFAFPSRFADIGAVSLLCVHGGVEDDVFFAAEY